MKRRAQFIGNFINISKSLACHVQRLNCLNLIANDAMCTKSIFGPVKSGKSSISLADLTEMLPLSLNEDLNLDPSLKISVFKWVKFRGLKYRPGGIIVTKKTYETHSGLPKFGIIRNVIVQNDQNDSKIFLQLSILKTVSYESHYHSYLIEERLTNQNMVLNITSCASVEPLDLLLNCSNDSNNYVAPRYII